MKLLKLVPVAAAAVLLAAPVMARAEGGAPVTAQHQPGEAHGHGMREGFMKRIDKNGDGKISKDEFIAVQTERFSKMDKNGDGYLSKEEMRAAREMVGGKMHRGRGPGRAAPGADDDSDYNE
jgi:hypothetical protein